MLYTYQCFGMICTSTFEIPSFLTVKTAQNQKIDFEITEGKTDYNFIVQDNSNEDVMVKEHQNDFFVYVPQAGKFQIQNGSKIIVEPNTQNWNDVIHNMLVECLPLLLLQRGLVPYHLSGVIDPNGGVWLFGGQSGVGKSTACLILQEEGYKLFSDDIVLLSIKDDKVFAKAGYPLFKLWSENKNSVKSSEIKKTFKLYSYLEKLGLSHHENFITDLREVKGFFFLNRNLDKKKIIPLSLSESFVKLINSIYFISILNKEKKKNLFKFTSDLVKKNEFWQISSSSQKDLKSLFLNLYQ